ncbi:MAG: formylglycine-generating enzyme family protein, partial [Planctomycetes bacterium]|nr:formylglycine-generating enzyme family protein [Planctomycetota bacterium]
KDPPPVTKGTEVTFDLGRGEKLAVIKINANGKKFLMGSPKDEVGRAANKDGFDPEEQHEVTFGHDYFMGKYEVTQGEYFAVMKTNPSKLIGLKHPVVEVSWSDAQEFIKKLNEKFQDQKVKFRLPSEAEWEYACRAGTTTAYYFGKTVMAEQANIGNMRKQTTMMVGSFEPNPYFRVRRGGSVNSPPADCRGAHRLGSPQENVGNYGGFRIAVDIADDSPVLHGKKD